MKVSPKKSVRRFEKNGKLSPRFLKPFEILERISLVAYCLAFLPFSPFHVLFVVERFIMESPS